MPERELGGELVGMMLDFERRRTQWKRLTRGSLAALLIAASGCDWPPKQPDDPPGDTETDGGPPDTDTVGNPPDTDTDDYPQPDTDTDDYPQPDTDTDGDPYPDTEGDTEACGEDTSATDSGPVVDPWSDVPCGDVMCSGNEVCVVPALDCDYSPCRQDMEAEWIQGPPECQPFPEHCDPGDPGYCIELEYCGPASEFGSFQDGAMECGPIALDCYCF